MAGQYSFELAARATAASAALRAPGAAEASLAATRVEVVRMAAIRAAADARLAAKAAARAAAKEAA